MKMSAHQADERFREVLTGLIEARYGSLTRTTLRQLASSAGLQYTTFARYFGFYGPAHQTKRLQHASVGAVLQALGVETEPVSETPSEKQLDLWPALVGPDPEPDPFTALEEVLGHLRRYAKPAQVIACRAAISAILTSLAENGQAAPLDAYDCLRQVDEMHPGTRYLKVV
jgi:AcrR family transcriptional regulator